VSNYLEFFGLRQQPFTLTTDPKFIYLATPHRDALVGLLRVAVLRKGFMVLTGDVGMGKTMVLHSALYLMQQKHSRFQSALLNMPTLKREELLEAILEDLQIPCPSESKVRRLNALRDRLFETHRAGGTTILMVDEAHLLSPDLIEELRLIAGIDAHDEKLLQLVLCGQTELHALLDLPQLSAMRQRISVWQRLQSLTAEEVDTYISGRLKAALCSKQNLFVGETLAAVIELSGGTPRLVNLICDTALTLAWEAKQNVITPEVVQNAGLLLKLHRTPPVASFAVAGISHADEHRHLRVQTSRIENR
jgi:general secretion pathway protein A